MKIIVNGKEQRVEKNLSLEDIVKQTDIQSQSLACAVNMNLIKKDDWCNYLPEENDFIEILNLSAN